jgi:hypothetical protein
VDRNSLGAETIEALQLQKNWLRNRVISSPLTELTMVIDGHTKQQDEVEIVEISP